MFPTVVELLYLFESEVGHNNHGGAHERQRSTSLADLRDSSPLAFRESPCPCLKFHVLHALFCIKRVLKDSEQWIQQSCRKIDHVKWPLRHFKLGSSGSETRLPLLNYTVSGATQGRRVLNCSQSDMVMR